jgi:dihydrodipicolinate synthase/N-acetylneuraminate lyase
MTAKRFPACNLATAVVPWTEDWRFDARLFRREVELLLASGLRNLYVFGTAGEGYAVSNAQFLQITQAFVEAMGASGAQPMVGVISLSLPTIVERIEAAHALGVRQFQIALPSWGVLSDEELFAFFDAVLPQFPDSAFLHYNLLRTKRLVTPAEYADLAARHPNLVATKNTTDSMTRVRDLVEQVPDLLHFLGESGYAFGSQIGDCGLLASVATTNAASAHAFFEGGRARDSATLVGMEGELRQIAKALLRTAGDGTQIDGAYDKVLWKLHDPAFPLRMLPPYRAAQPDAADRLRTFLSTSLPRWAP